METPGAVVLNEGEGFDLHVRVEGKPLPEITWLKDGNRLYEDEQTRIVTESNEQLWETRSAVDIRNVNLSDESKKYVIEASNVVGKIIHEFEVFGKLSLSVIFQSFPIYT